MTPEQAVQKLSQEVKSKDKTDPFSAYRGAEKWNICSLETSMLTRMADQFTKILTSGTNTEDLLELAKHSIMLAAYLSDDDNLTPKEETPKKKKVSKKLETALPEDGQEYMDV